MWSEVVDNNRYAKWLKDLQSKVNATKQEKKDITKQNLKKIFGRMPNWKLPGPDLFQRFWLKNCSGLHGILSLKLKECLGSCFFP